MQSRHLRRDMLTILRISSAINSQSGAHNTACRDATRIVLTVRLLM
jgi:hypothetical protein